MLLIRSGFQLYDFWGCSSLSLRPEGLEEYGGMADESWQCPECDSTINVERPVVEDEDVNQTAFLLTARRVAFTAP